MKYIRFAGYQNNFHLFSDDEIHSEVAERLGGRVISAGFVEQTPNGLNCYGCSVSLECTSRPDDGEELRTLFK